MAKLIVRQGRNAGAEYDLPDAGEVILGRKGGTGIQVADPQASREHAAVGCEGGSYYVRDLGSANGTFFGTERIKGKQPFAPGARLRIGETTYDLVLGRTSGGQPQGAGAALVAEGAQVVPTDGRTPVPVSNRAAAAVAAPAPAASNTAAARPEDDEKGGTKVFEVVCTPFYRRKPLRYALVGSGAAGIVLAAVLFLTGGERKERPPAATPARPAATFDDDTYVRSQEYVARQRRRMAREDAVGEEPSGKVLAQVASASEVAEPARAATALAEPASAGVQTTAPAADLPVAVGIEDDEPSAKVTLVAGDTPATETFAKPPAQKIDLDKLSPVAREIRTLTGARTKVVWIQDQDQNNDTFARRAIHKLMGFDTDDRREERQILPHVANYAQPIITPRGDRIVFSNPAEKAVYVVGFDGTGLKPLAKGLAAEVWMDPATLVEWVYIQVGEGDVGGNFKENPIWRFQLDKPKVQNVVWDKTGVDIVRFSGFSLSADGTHAGGCLPWNSCGVANLAGGTWEIFGIGCWPSLAPDDSYRLFHFDGPHRNVYVYEADGTGSRKVPINTFPGCGPQHEVYHPRWSNDVRFMTLTGPYLHHGGPSFEEGAAIEVQLGRFDAGLTSIEGWVAVTRNTRADFYPDVWIDHGTAGTLVAKAVPASPAARILVKPPQELRRRWPSDLTRLVFRWQDGEKGNQLLDQLAGRMRACGIEARLTARFGRFHDMDLNFGGYFPAIGGNKEILNACRLLGAVSFEALVTPKDLAQNGTIVSFSDKDKQNFSLEQQGEQLVLRLRTANHSPSEPIGVAKLADAEPHYLAVSYASGELFAALDGRVASMTNLVKGALAPWSGGELVLGAETDGTSPWEGTLLGVAVYARALTPAETKENAEYWRQKLAARTPARRVTVKVKLAGASRIPRPDTILPYRRALVVNVYDVLGVAEGAYAHKQIAVASWAIMDGELLSMGDRAKHPVDTITAESFDDHPQLRSEMMMQDAGGYELPLYYEAGS